SGRLTASAASPQPAHPVALAPVSNSMLHQLTWNGQPISDGVDFAQIIARYTYVGDDTLDGKVDQFDLVNIIANMGRSGASWLDGDFNLDGLVTLADYNLATANLGAGTGGSG